MQYRSISAAALLFTAAAACADPAFEVDPGPVSVEAAAGSSAGAGGAAGGVGGSLAAGSPAESPADRGGAGGSSAGAGGAGGVGGSSAAGSPAEPPPAAGSGGAAAGSSAGAGGVGGVGGVGGSSAGGVKIRCIAGDYNMTCASAKLAHISILWSVHTGPDTSTGYNCNVSASLPCVIGDACTMLISDGRTLTGKCAQP